MRCIAAARAAGGEARGAAGAQRRPPALCRGAHPVPGFLVLLLLCHGRWPTGVTLCATAAAAEVPSGSAAGWGAGSPAGQGGAAISE